MDRETLLNILEKEQKRFDIYGSDCYMGKHAKYRISLVEEILADNFDNLTYSEKEN